MYTSLDLFRRDARETNPLFVGPTISFKFIEGVGYVAYTPGQIVLAEDELNEVIEEVLSDYAPDDQVAAHNQAVLEERKQKAWDVWFKSSSEGSPSTPLPKRDAVPGHVYLFRGVGTDYYKIGCSINPTQRLETVSPVMPFKTELICQIETDDMYGLEAELHEEFAENRQNGEWFKLTDSDVERLKTVRGDHE
jgi:hypothetical protein